MSLESPNANLSGKVAVVTGGSRGIGKAICLRLAQAGADVAVNYAKNAQMAEEVVREIQDTYQVKALAVGFDVAAEAEVERGIKEILEYFSRIDILVNNAGITADALMLRAKTEDWQRVLDVNLSGTFFAIRAAVKPMLKTKSGGRIINLSSVIGEMGNAGQVGYAASKSALFGLTKSLARELGSRGITVNAVTPGFIKTDMTTVLTDEQVAKMLEGIALGRLGEAEDVAELVNFLASPAAAYITGQVIGVNGGLYM